MDEQQQQRLNEAAEQFANAVKESYRTMAERGVSAQELNAQMTQQFLNQVINNLRTQAADTRQMTQSLADQQERVLGAAQELTQEGVGAYMEFVNSLLSMSQVIPQAAKQAQERSR